MSSSRLPLSSRPTFLPDEIARREFATVFRGYDQAEIRTFLNQLAEQSAESADRIAEFQKALIETEERAKNPELDEEMVTRLLGEQTAQILRSAREAANEIRSRAEEEVSRQLREAHEVTTRMREEAETLLIERTEEAEKMAEVTRSTAATEAENLVRNATEEAARIRTEVAAEAERDRSATEAELLHLRQQTQSDLVDERARARQQARDLVDTARNEAQALVERTRDKQNELVEGLIRKRKIALAQVEELRAGRERLLKAYKMVRSTLDEVTIELGRVDDEARQVAEEAGVQSATMNGIESTELDTAIEIEQYSLDDDVPTTVIDLIEGDDAALENLRPSSGESSASSSPATSSASSAPSSDTSPYSASGGTATAMNQGLFTAFATEATQTEATQTEATRDEIEVIDEPVIRSTSTSTGLIIGESYAAGIDEEMDRALKLRRDSVVSKARSQAVRRLKRALQDEQETIVTRMRTGDAQSVQALLGSADDQAASYQRAVVKIFREVVRSGASSVEGSTGVERGVIDHTGTVAARGLATELVEDLRVQLQSVLDDLLATSPLPSVGELQHRIAEPYRAVKGEHLEQLVDDRIGGVFDQGVAFARS